MCNRNFLLIGLFIGIGVALAACSTSESALGVNTGSDGVALRGFDAVAYFAVDNAVKGDPKFEYVWNGAKWLFSSEDNMRKFQANPETYAPQFGGYCSWAVSRNYTASIDPQAFTIVDDKLYLNYSTDVQTRWRLDREGNIAKGRQNWPALVAKAAPAGATKKGGR